MQDITTIPIGPPGTGKPSWNLPNSYQIAGVTIDNPCGSWLLIVEDNTYIPPYTFRFAHTFAPTLNRISIMYANGPAGQISTQEGDVPTAQIYDRPVAESAGLQDSTGAAFVNRSDQPEVQTGLIALHAPDPTANSTFTTFLAGSTTKRLRVYGVIFQTINPVTPAAVRPNELIRCSVNESNPPFDQMAVADTNLTPNKFYDHVPTFINAQDLLPGREMICLTDGDPTTVPDLEVLFEIVYSIL